MSKKSVFIHFSEQVAIKVICENNWTASDILQKFLIEFEQKCKDYNGPTLTYWNTKIYGPKNNELDMNSKLFNDGDDLEVKFDPSWQSRTKICTNYGCRQSYSEETKDSTICYHHPGNPLFHEGRKGWTCCSTRVDDFDEAMTIPGCASGQHHSNPPPMKKSQSHPKPVASYSPTLVDEFGVETFSIPGALKKPSQPSSKPSSQSETVSIIEEPDDPENASIAPGTACRHHGCHTKYQDESTKRTVCSYHPGQAIFHEGSKYWSCCKPRCAEFEEFLKIPPCKQGKHKFCPPPNEIQDMDPNIVKCRYDFYQSEPTVVACIYAKNVDKQNSTIEFSKHIVKIHIKFTDGKYFKKDWILFGPIDETTSKYEILTTKIELTLNKSEPLVWEKLEKPDV